MIIKETSVFTRRIKKLLDDESYRLLQLQLVVDPLCGVPMPGTGGLRKLRWSSAGRGRRGGVRVIYYWMAEHETLLMLLLYGKSEQTISRQSR